MCFNPQVAQLARLLVINRRLEMFSPQDQEEHHGKFDKLPAFRRIWSIPIDPPCETITLFGDYKHLQDIVCPKPLYQRAGQAAPDQAIDLDSP